MKQNPCDISKGKVSPTYMSLKDIELAKALEDSLLHDDRTHHLRLSIIVKGCVAHVRGIVQSEEERQIVEEILRRQHGLYSVWGLLTLPGEKLSILDIGCGTTKQVPEAIGVDKYPAEGVAIVTNLEKGLPFPENSFDHIFAIHILEHIYNLISLLNNVHKILRPFGVLHVMVPKWRSVVSVADPTHVRFFDVQTLKYFCEKKYGVSLWKPLMVSTSDDTIFADLTPIKGAKSPRPSDIARWFY